MNDVKALNFESGLVTYNINGKCQVSFNPTDSNFVERLYLAFEDLDKKQESYKTQVEKLADKREIFDLPGSGMRRCGKSLMGCLMLR